MTKEVTLRETPWNRLRRATGVAPCKGGGGMTRSAWSLGVFHSYALSATRSPSKPEGRSVNTTISTMKAKMSA